MTTDGAAFGHDSATARQTKVIAQMLLRERGRGQAIHAFHDFDHALLALALFAAGSGHGDTEHLRIFEQRTARYHVPMLVIQVQRYTHPMPILTSLSDTIWTAG